MVRTKTVVILGWRVRWWWRLAGAARAEDSDRFRPYVGLRFFDTNPATGVHDLFGFSLGANLNRYFGVELSGDRYEVFPDISPYGTIGEYGVFALIPQVRVRYPVFEDKLVPYIIGGVGAAFTQFNDRKPRGFGLSIQDQSSTVVAGTAGLGIEYFIADNIAVGIEAKYLFAPDPTLVVQGNREKVKISAPLFTFGMRMFYPELTPAPMAEAREHVPTRLYVGVRAGGAVILNSELIPGLEAEPTNNAIGGALTKYFGVSGGFNFGRYLGLEIALDGYEVNLDLSGAGNIGEYAVYTAIPYVRLRYPMAGDRLQPYLLGGFGYGYTEFNDRKPPGENLSIEAKSSSWAMGFGGRDRVLRDKQHRARARDEVRLHAGALHHDRLEPGPRCGAVGPPLLPRSARLSPRPPVVEAVGAPAVSHRSTHRRPLGHDQGRRAPDELG